MTIFDQILQARIDTLSSYFTATTGLEHNLEKGMFRELFVKQLIHSILPTHFGIGSGVVIDKWDRQSPQVDVVIYDKRRLPPIFEEDGHGIYPIDAVIRIIEVKSQLKRDSLQQLKTLINAFDPANDNGLKMGMDGNLEKQQSFYPVVSLVAYNSTMIEPTPESVMAELKVDPEENPVCILNRGVVGRPDTDVINTVKMFFSLSLGAIEATANSRKEYSIIEWMF